MNVYALTDRMVLSVSGDHAEAEKLQLACLQQISLQLPKVASKAIDVAVQYWIDHSVGPSELEQARIDCWKYLDERKASTKTEEPEFCAIRAVICVLYQAPCSDDIAEGVEFFLRMLREAWTEVSDEEFTNTVVFIADKKKLMGTP